MTHTVHGWFLGHRTRTSEKKSSPLKRWRERSLERIRAKARDANKLARLIDEELRDHEERVASGAPYLADFKRQNEEVRIRLHRMRGEYAARLNISFEDVCAL